MNLVRVNPQSLVRMTRWLCAQAVSVYVPLRIADFTTQAVSNTIWGCSVLNYYDSDLYATVAEELRSAPLAALQSPWSCQRIRGLI